MLHYLHANGVTQLEMHRSMEHVRSMDMPRKARSARWVGMMHKARHQAKLKQ